MGIFSLIFFFLSLFSYLPVALYIKQKKRKKINDGNERRKKTTTKEVLSTLFLCFVHFCLCIMSAPVFFFFCSAIRCSSRVFSPCNKVSTLLCEISKKSYKKRKYLD